MAIKRFEDIEAWQASRRLTTAIYTLACNGRLGKDFGLKDQIQRASVSIMANIAEGFDARSDGEFLRFLGYAYRSATEVQSHLYVVLDNGYCDQEAFDQLYGAATDVKRLLNGFIRYLRKDQSEVRSPRSITPLDS